jgi:NAD(P)-dependent dehydrogenase (short-subunit alcohol dehydrogenase family)
MKVLVIGGTGLIGSKVVAKLTEQGHEAIAASPASGVNTLTGEGLAGVLTGAQAVVDVSNSPSFEDGPAWDFFTGGILEVAGPDRYPLDDLVLARLRASNDTRRAVTDTQSRYFGVVLDVHTLVPGPAATVFPSRFEDWLLDNAPAPAR